MTVVEVVLAAVAASAILALLTRRLWAAFLLAACSALWLPVNNGRLEGPVLFPVAHGHGLTMTDLISCIGVWLAIRICRRSGHPLAGRVAVGCAVVLMLGFLAAFIAGSGGLGRHFAATAWAE